MRSTSYAAPSFSRRAAKTMPDPPATSQPPLPVLDDPVPLAGRPLHAVDERLRALNASDADAVNRLLERLVALGGQRAAIYAAHSAPAGSEQPPGRRTPVPGAQAPTRAQQAAAYRAAMVPLGIAAAGIERDVNAQLQRLGRPSAEADLFLAHLHSRVAGAVTTHLDAAARAYAEAWETYERACFLAALMHWTRERVNRGRDFRPPIGMGTISPRDFTRLRPTATGRRWANLLEGAQDGFVDHVRQQQRGQFPRAVDGARAVGVAVWTCGYRALTTPTIVQRRLRAILRTLHGHVNESVRALEDARVLGLDQPPARTGPFDVRTQVLAASSDARNRQWAAGRVVGRRRTLLWLGASGGGAVLDAVRTWRRRRNELLTRELTSGGYLARLPPEELRFLAESSPDVSDVTVGPDGSPRRLRVARARGTSNARSTAEVQGDLDRLYLLFHAFRYRGFPRPPVTSRSRETVSSPELLWSALVSSTSATYDGLHASGFGREQRAIGIGTYNGHGPESSDVALPHATELRVAFPRRVYLGRSLLGADANAPIGWYRAASWQRGSSSIASAATDLYTKWTAGYFGNTGRFPVEWPRALARRDLGSPFPAHIEADLANRSPIEQYVIVYRRRNDLTPAWRRALFRGGDGFPRHVDVDRFLAGLFFRETIAGRPDEPDVERLREAVGAELDRALAARWSAARPADWTGSADGWRSLLRHFATDADARRAHHGVTFTAIARTVAYQRDLVRALRREAPVSGRIPIAFERVADQGASASAADVAAMRRAMTEYARLFTTFTRDLLNEGDAAAGSPAEHFHVVLLGNIVILRAPGMSGTAPAPAEAIEADPATFGGLGAEGSRPGGASTQLVVRYEREERGTPFTVHAVIEMTHLQRVNQSIATTPLAVRGAGDAMSVGDAPVLGVTGVSGNSVSPHVHMTVELWLERPGTRDAGPRPLAIVPLIDFFGQLRFAPGGLSGPLDVPPPPPADPPTATAPLAAPSPASPP